MHVLPLPHTTALRSLTGFYIARIEYLLRVYNMLYKCDRVELVSNQT